MGRFDRATWMGKVQFSPLYFRRVLVICVFKPHFYSLWIEEHSLAEYNDIVIITPFLTLEKHCALLYFLFIFFYSSGVSQRICYMTCHVMIGELRIQVILLM